MDAIRGGRLVHYPVSRVGAFRGGAYSGGALIRAGGYNTVLEDFFAY